MAIIQFKMAGQEGERLRLAEPGWAIETNTLYVGGSAGNVAIAGGGGGMTAHEMTGAYHTASGLSAGCIVRATGATTFAWQKLQHTDLDGVSANQHHNQEHGITSASDHTIGGSAYDLVGLTANSTLGLLKPTYRPDGAEVILKSNSSGWIWPTRLGVGAASPVSHQAFGARLEYTDLATAPTGGYFSVTLVPAASVSYTNPFGLFSGIYNDSVENVGDVTGIESDVINSTTGSMGTAVGVVGKISNDGGISSAIALLASAINNNNSIAAAYGLRVYDQDQATVNYAIHTGTGLNSFGDNIQFRQSASVVSVGQLTLDGANGVVINEDGDDEDFRVEGTGKANALFVQGSDGFVGVNNGAPVYQFDVTGNTRLNGIMSVGTTPNAVATMNAYRTKAANAGIDYGMLNILEYNGGVAYTGVLEGYEGRVTNSVAQTVAVAIGMLPAIYNTHASGTITVARGIQTSIVNSGSIGTVQSFYVANPTGGTITTNYGVYVVGQTAGATNYAIYTNAGDVRLMASASDKLGFHGSAPVAKQTVTGSRGGNAALADLLTKLATLGLIVDSTSA